MNLGRVILIVVAIAVAGGAAFLVKYLLDKQRDDAKASRGSETEAIEVLVADRPLARGVITTAEHFLWAKWPADKVNPNYIVRKPGTKTSDYVGQAVLRPVAAGEPILLPKLLKPGTASFLEAVLNPGMRGYTIRVNTITNNANFVLPGIHVDILWTYTVRTRDQDGRRVSYAASETLRKNVRVLAIGSNLSEAVRSKTKAARSKYITLEVTPKDAEIFAVAQRKGRLRLLVRSLKRNPEKERLGEVTTEFELGPLFGKARIGSNWVLVAKKEYPVGSFLRSDEFEWRPLPPGSNDDGLISRRRFLSEFIFHGALVTKAVKQGQPIPRRSVILTTESRFITSALKSDKHAITLRRIPGNVDLRYVAAGDLVDIRFDGTVKYTSNIGVSVKPELAFSEIIVTKARIVSMLGGMTVEVTPVEANRLRVAMLSKNGTLSFAVRAQGDNRIVPPLNTELEVSKHKLDALSGLDPMTRRIRRLQQYYRRQDDRSGDFDRSIKVYRATRQSRIVVTE